MLLGPLCRRAAAVGWVCALVAGCHSDLGSDDVESLRKVVPATVSAPAAWSLFDRSIQSSFIPGKERVTVSLDRAAQISAIKVYGAAPYRLHITGGQGSSIGIPTIDLSNVGAGWHVFPATALVSTSNVELNFESIGTTTGTIPELEIWAVDEQGASSAPPDLTAAAKDLPPSFVSLPATSTDAALAPSECGTFGVDVTRTPSGFERAYIVYTSKGAFRPFVLRRSINGLAETERLDRFGSCYDGRRRRRRAASARIHPADLARRACTLGAPIPQSGDRLVDRMHRSGQQDERADLACTDGG